jgi:hypothetical protein
MPLRRISRRVRNTLLCAVLIALALAQTLSLLHRIVHAPHLWAAPASVEHALDQGWFKTLFAGHDHAGGCELYDQLGHADLMWGEPADPCAVQATELRLCDHPGWLLASQAAGFLARGPPGLS